MKKIKRRKHTTIVQKKDTGYITQSLTSMVQLTKRKKTASLDF